jgi:hypothetical protein
LAFGKRHQRWKKGAAEYDHLLATSLTVSGGLTRDRGRGVKLLKQGFDE